MRRRLIVVIALGACASTRPTPMSLQRVILYQNGIGYFERSGHLAGGKLHLALARGELDDVLKTLTVIDRLGGAVATVDVPMVKDGERTIGLDVRLGAGRAHDLSVSYAVPQPTWKAAYRVVLGGGERGDALLQAWAMVNNATEEDWQGVSLTLATGAPMSFALDLHTPEYVKRPDAGGVLHAPTVLGPIGEDRAVAADHDADGIPDAVDRCPDERGDGDEEDGCPTGKRRALVVVSDSQLEILQPVMFAAGSDALGADALKVIETVATVLKGNMDVEKIELGGHAVEGESEVWGLSSRRAEAVRAELVKRGVAAGRLQIQPYGATQGSERRVDFLILKRHADATAAGMGTRIDVASVAASTRAKTKPIAVAGTVRYAVSEPISIARGASAMVSILNKQVSAEEVELWRPDANAPGSDKHPFRAVKLTNTSGFTLEPGPIAIFAGGTFVGDTLLGRLGVGETAWIPYAVDGATDVAVQVASDEKPVKIATIAKGVMTVETAGVRVTTYRWEAGLDPARALVIRHERAAGYEVVGGLPPGSVDRGDGVAMVVVPVTKGKSGVVTVTEREPRKREIAVSDVRPADLAAYVEGSALPAEVGARVAEVVKLREAVAAKETEIAGLREQIADVSARAAEVRDTLKTLGAVKGADDLKKKLVAALATATADADAHARALGAASAELAAARGRLADALRELRLP